MIALLLDLAAWWLSRAAVDPLRLARRAQAARSATGRHLPPTSGRAIGAQAGGVPEAPAVAQPSQTGTPASAYTDAGRELSICRENYLRARKTAERLEEARRWYESLECGK